MQSAALTDATRASRLNECLNSRWMLYLLIALTIPARLLWMHFSLWLDEAWVANAVTEPSLKQMIYYSHWVQSTPVLFLILERVGATLFGANEIAIRLVPWIGSFAAAFVFCDALRILFPLPLTTGFVALFSANYWAIKYGQQLKQYGTDLFVSAMLVWLISLLLAGSANRRRWRWAVLLGIIFCFFSMPTVFFVPGLVIALALARTGYEARPGKMLRREFLRVAGPVLTLFVLAIGADYMLFIAPNHPDIVAADWDIAYRAYLGSAPLLTTVPEFLRTLGNLLIPRVSSLGALPWLVLSAVLSVGIVRSIVGTLKGNKTATVALLAGVLPVGTAMVASWMRKYPLLDYPRLVLWMLPPVLLLLASAIEPAVAFCLKKWQHRKTVQIPAVAFAASALFVLGSSALVAHQRVSSENNRELFSRVAKSWQPSDAVFIHGGLVEQFDYYRHELKWNPKRVYIGNTDWPCCALEQKQRSSEPLVTSLSEDLAVAVRSLHPGTLWVVLPSGSSDGWSGALAPRLKTVPAALSDIGCQVSRIHEFGQVMLEAADCRSAGRLDIR